MKNGGFENVSSSKFKIHYDFLRDPRPLNFPRYEYYPFQVKEIFEYYKALITKDDLYKFATRELYKENIVNVYLKLLEKIHFLH